jgi:hypothetical protein
VYMCNYRSHKSQNCNVKEFEAAWKLADTKCAIDGAVRVSQYAGLEHERSYGRGVVGDTICGHGMKGRSDDKDGGLGTFGKG